MLIMNIIEKCARLHLKKLDTLFTFPPMFGQNDFGCDNKRKLPPIDSYHVFSNSKDAYLAKNHHGPLTIDCSYVTIVTSRKQAFFVTIFDDF